MKTHHKIVLGDSRQMSNVSDESVHLVVTSPPYWQLKDYGIRHQIGFHDSYESYINNLNLVWKECHRVLHEGCRLCVNIGDQFARSVYYGRYKVIPIREEIIRFCESIGFDYMGAIIWQKVTTSNTTGGGVQMGSYPFPRNGIIKIDYEFVLILKKPGDGPKPTKEVKELSRMTNEEWNTYFAGHWNFAGARQSGHIAVFPEELPKRLIKMFAFLGDTVLDPFAGSGTTALAAKNLGRHSINYEINPEFLPAMKDKLSIANDAAGATYEILEQPGDSEFAKEVKKLPYVFKDPHQLDTKIDLKKLQFGSIIDKSSSRKREEFFTVKEIIAPDRLMLNNNLLVRLIGIKENPAVNGKAKTFLNEKTKGRRVFLKYDNLKYDNDNNLLCYLYLENRTFINAHLLKKKLADVDIQYPFRYKNKFIDLSKAVHDGKKS